MGYSGPQGNRTNRIKGKERERLIYLEGLAHPIIEAEKVKICSWWVGDLGESMGGEVSV